MDHQADAHSRDVVLGTPFCRIYERSALGPLPPTPTAPPSFGVSVRRTSKMFGWWMRGLARPTPFFDDSTKAPCSAPACSRGVSAQPFERRCARASHVSNQQGCQYIFCLECGAQASLAILAARVARC